MVVNNIQANDEALPMKNRKESNVGFWILLIIILFTLMLSLGMETRRADQAELALNSYILTIEKTTDQETMRAILREETRLTPEEIDRLIKQIGEREQMVIDAKHYLTINFRED
jgi:hypothetical protein